MKFKFSWKYRIISVLLISYVLLMAFAPTPPQERIQTAQVKIIHLHTDGTTILVKGYSPYDPYDRIVMLFDNGIEVARIITPLHRDAKLPNSFEQIVNLPYPIHNTQLVWSVINTYYVWNISINVVIQTDKNLRMNPIYVNTTNGLIPLQATTSLVGYTFQVYVPVNETVYWIVSGHNLLEGLDNLTITIDGQAYNVYNWHPLNDDYQLTNVGVVIPYIKINMTSGYHMVILSGSPHIHGSGAGYYLYSAFGVCECNQTKPKIG